MKVFNLFIYISALLFFIIIYIGGFFDIYVPIVLILIFVLVLLVQFLYRSYTDFVNAYCSWGLKLSSLFICSYVIVCFQANVDYVLGYDSLPFFVFVRGTKVAYLSCILASISLVSFMIGYEFMLLKHYGAQYRISFSTNTRIISYPLLPLNIISLFLLLLYYVFVGRDYLSGGYGRVEKSAGGEYISLLFEISIYAILFYFIRRSDTFNISFQRFLRKLGWLFWTTLFIYFCLVLFSGDRGPIIYLSLSILLTYLLTVRKKINSFKVIFLMVIAASVVTLLGIARKFPSDLSFSEKIDLAVNAIDGDERLMDSVSPVTMELAGSAKCVNLAVDYMQNTSDYGLGKYTLSILFSIPPFLGGIIMNLFDTPKYESGVSDFLTYLDQGEDPSYGVGSVCFAEFYMDFSVIGVVAGMGLFGCLVRILEIRSFSSSIPGAFLLCLILMYYSKAIYIPRASILMELKGTIWLFVYVKCYQFLYDELLKRRIVVKS